MILMLYNSSSGFGFDFHWGTIYLKDKIKYIIFAKQRQQEKPMGLNLCNLAARKLLRLYKKVKCQISKILTRNRNQLDLIKRSIFRRFFVKFPNCSDSYSEEQPGTAASLLFLLSSWVS